MRQNSTIFYLHITFLMLLVTFTVSSQNIPQIDVLTTEQGLTFRDVRAVAQDTMGFMWFGTQQGLNRYDGYNFKVYNSNKGNPNFIENDKITSNIKLVESTNNLWYVANEKLFRLELQTDYVTDFTEANGIRGQVLLLYLDELYSYNNHNKLESKTYLI